MQPSGSKHQVASFHYGGKGLCLQMKPPNHCLQEPATTANMLSYVLLHHWNQQSEETFPISTSFQIYIFKLCFEAVKAEQLQNPANNAAKNRHKTSEQQASTGP